MMATWKNLISGEVYKEFETAVKDYELNHKDKYFDEVIEEEKSENITVVYVAPGQKPVVMDIKNELEDFQRLVDGYIECIDYGCGTIICNEEGKICGLPLNRALFCEGEPYEIIAGSFIVCSETPMGNFESLTAGQQELFCEQFESPESFVFVDGQLCVIPQADAFIDSFDYENRE